MKQYQLPPYPCEVDVWDMLKRETRPLVIWGMGNGADKLLVQFEEHGLEVADFMASDGFVRGQFFHGKQVLSFASMKEKYEDFAIVLAFASSREEVLSLMFERADTYTLYMPDLPVCPPTYFDKEFYNDHYDEIKAVYDLLADDVSKNLYAAILWYKLTGDIRILRDAYTTPDMTWELIDPTTITTYVDCGAYNGDTLKELLSLGAPLTHAICIEPDKRTFKKLSAYVEALEGILVENINAAVWSEDAIGTFEESGNRNSSIANPSFEHKTQEVALVAVDSLCGDLVPQYIKYDVEGAEMQALLGSSLTFEKKPKALISLYHKSEDVFEIPLAFIRQHPGYDLYLRRPLCVPAWEINLIVLPKE